jgi:hypothetical protein
VLTSATLDSFFDEPYDPPLVDKIRQRRIQMMVHSYLYYVLDSPVITDDKWQQWADELTALQLQKKQIGFYDEEFADWDGSTGMHLPKDDWIDYRARWLDKNT